jgi:hypothetical protein
MSTAPGATGEHIQASMKEWEAWFAKRGVPYFCPEYQGRTRFDSVAVFLFAMLALEVGVASLDLSALGLIVGLTTVLYVVLILTLVGGERPRRLRHQWIPVALLLGAIGMIVSYAVDLPISRWVDALIVFIGLYAAFELADCNVWTGTDAERRRRRAGVVAITLVAVVGFALEGSVFEGPVDQALLALVVVVAILRLARSLARPVRSADPVPRREPAIVAAMVPVVPLLVVLLGAETAVLPHIGASTLIQTTAPLALTALLALAAVLAFIRANRPDVAPVAVPNADHVRELGRHLPVDSVWIAAWVLPFLVTYPVLVYFFFELDTFGARLDGLDAALVALGINVLFLGVAWVVVAFGIDAFARTVGEQVKSIVESIVMALANGLPLLVVFTVFFALTAETWEVAAEATMGYYLALLGALFAFTLVFIVASAAIELRRESRFDGWDQVRRAAVREDEIHRTTPPPDDFDAGLATVVERHAGHENETCLALKGRSWLNAMGVLTAYQLIVFFPVTVAAALLFWGLGKLAVPADVAAEWIGGDDVTAAQVRDITTDRALTEEPWLRVGVLLGAFSSLYLAVTVQANDAQRKQFFDATERGVKQLLAVKLVYDSHRAPVPHSSAVVAGPHCRR